MPRLATASARRSGSPRCWPPTLTRPSSAYGTWATSTRPRPLSASRRTAGSRACARPDCPNDDDPGREAALMTGVLERPAKLLASRAEASQLRLLLEELCCDMCRFVTLPGGPPL